MHIQKSNYPLPLYMLITIIVVMLLIFAIMLDKYSMFGVDDSWTLSFDYHYLRDGYEFDKVVGHGQAVLAYFGKTHAFVYGAWAKLFGWGRYVNRLLSTLFIIFSAYLWAQSTRILFASVKAAWMVFILCILFDAFMSNATKTRPEALVLFFCAAALRLFLVQNRWTSALAGFLVGLAVETHPIGITSVIFLVAVYISYRKTGERLLISTLIVGVLLGIGYYLFLHYRYVTDIFSLPDGAEKGLPFSFLSSFFLRSRFNRHLPDLFFAFFAFVLLILRWKQLVAYRRGGYFIVFTTIGIVLLALVFPRGNEQYGSFIYPSLIMLYTMLALHYQKTMPVILLFFFFSLPQYLYVAWSYRNINFNEFIQEVREHLPSTSVLTVGHSIYWFAVSNDPEHEFYTANNASAPLEGRVFYRIYSDNSWERETASLRPFEKTLQALGNAEPYSSFDYNGMQVYIDRFDYRTQLP